MKNLTNLKTPRQNYPLTLLYDGNCPICQLEMTKLEQRNAAGLLRFTNISAPEFAATHEPQYAARGASMAAMQAQIHAERPDGSFAIGVPALVLAYQAVGLGAWVQPVTWPLLQPLANAAYRLFARYRYVFSALFSKAIALVAARRAAASARACQADLGKGGACADSKPASDAPSSRRAS